MNKRISAKELSAYVDGEARNPDAVRAAIETSQEVAREHLALQQVSARLRALPEPEIRPGFAHRVVAHVRANNSEAVRSSSWRLPVAASLAAAAILLAVTALNRLPSHTTAPAPAVTAMAPTAPSPDSTTLGEDAIIAEIERRVASDESVQAFVTARFDQAPQPGDLYKNDLLVALMQSQKFGQADAALAYGADYRPALRNLDHEQAQVLKDVLAASVRQAHEG